MKIRQTNKIFVEICVSQGLQCKEGAINLVFITQTFANLSLNFFRGTNFSNSYQDTYDQIFYVVDTKKLSL